MKRRSRPAENARVHFYTCQIEGQRWQHKQSAMMEEVKVFKHQVILLKTCLTTNKNRLFELLLQPLDGLPAGVELAIQVAHLDLGHSFHTHCHIRVQERLCSIIFKDCSTYTPVL